MADVIQIKDLQISVPLRCGARWPKPPSEPSLQPLLVSLSVFHNIRQTALTDDLSFSINYSELAKQFKSSAESRGPFDDIEHLCYLAFDVFSPSQFTRLAISIIQLRPPLHSDQVEVRLEASANNGCWNFCSKTYAISGISCDAILGINDCEREDSQRILFNIRVNTPPSLVSSRQQLQLRKIISTVYNSISQSSYYTLEALVSNVALLVLKHMHPTKSNLENVWEVVVDGAKPCALVFASFPLVQITRTAADYPQAILPHTSKEPQSPSIAVISFGSNQGDRFQNIESSLRLLESIVTEPNAYLNVIDTSFLYETTPMYVVDQPSFINGACVVETSVPPVDLVRLMKKIEIEIGRIPSERNGPRAIDLDLIFYDDEIVDTRPSAEQMSLDNLEGQVVVPHLRVSEREFVLRPLNDMIPEHRHPVLGTTIGQLLKGVIPDLEMRRVIPFPEPSKPIASKLDQFGTPRTSTSWPFPVAGSDRRNHTKTKIMATINATPDSFSDGADHLALNDALSHTKRIISSADMLDIGGYSTRPGAAFVTEEEEIKRVTPIIQAIRDGLDNEAWGNPNTPISIDTFRPEVARAALAVGANCINDVYAFGGTDPRTSEETMELMKSLSRNTCVVVILMHSRGDAGSQKDYSQFVYAGKDMSTVEGVRVELGNQVEKIVRGKGGVRRWLVIVDPGIGFSKTIDGNLELLRASKDIVADLSIGGGISRRNPLFGFPLLSGPSRKSFLGEILQGGDSGRKTGPKERDWATGGAVASAVQQGALIVRVHAVQEMADIVSVCNRIW